MRDKNNNNNRNCEYVDHILPYRLKWELDAQTNSLIQVKSEEGTTNLKEKTISYKNFGIEMVSIHK